MVFGYIKRLVYKQVFSLSYYLTTSIVVGTVTGSYSTIIRASTLMYTLTPYVYQTCTSAYSAVTSSVVGASTSSAGLTPSAPPLPADEMDHPGKQPNSGSFGSALETMDRFLETNDGNLLVQSLISLEGRTNISRRYLARAFLFILVGYFLFSNSVLDLLTHLLMFLYPSYRSYLLLQNVDRLSKEDLVDILKYWIFIGLFATVDFVLGYLIPFVSVFKLIFIIQCVLPRRSPAVQLAHSHFVTPLYRHLEKNESIQQVNDYVASLASSLKANANDHQD